MTTRSWQIYGVGFIVAVVVAVIALWMSPADAQTDQSGQAARSKPRLVRVKPAERAPAPRETPPPQPTPEPAPAPRTAPVLRPAPRPATPPVVTPRPVSPTPQPAPREPVAPAAPVVTPRPQPTTPSIPAVVEPAPTDAPRSGPRDRPTPPARPAPPKLPQEPAPPPPPVLDPLFEVGPIPVTDDVLYCEQALVCPLDRWDDQVAWRLAWATGTHYWQIAYERLDGWSWYAIMNRLDIDRRTFYDALNVSWSPQGHFRDDDVRMAMVHETGDLIVPEFSCELPLQLPSPRQFPILPDAVDERIAQRISEETLWCADTLLSLHGRLRNWGAVARTVYLSPYMFQSIYGIQLEVLDGVLQYPAEADVRFAELENPDGLVRGDQGSGLGKVAKGLTLVALGVAGVVAGFF